MKQRGTKMKHKTSFIFILILSAFIFGCPNTLTIAKNSSKTYIYFNRNVNDVQQEPSICIDGDITTLQDENSRKYMAQYGIAIYENNVVIRGISTDDGINRYTGCWVNNVWQDWSKNDISIMEEQISSIAVNNDSIYMNGNCRNNITNSYQPGYWQNKDWHPLPVINDKVDNMTYGIALSPNGVIVVGTQESYIGDNPEKPIDTPDYVNTPGYWLNDEWHPLPINNVFGGAIAYNAIVGSGITYITGVQFEENSCRVGYWKNGIWNYLPIPETMIFNNFTKCYFYNNNLYIIGLMQNKSNNLSYIPGYWENDNWISLPYSGNMAKVNYIYYNNNTIYVAGFNGKENGYWENGIWKTYDSIRDDDLAIKALIIKSN